MGKHQYLDKREIITLVKMFWAIFNHGEAVQKQRESKNLTSEQLSETDYFISTLRLLNQLLKFVNKLIRKYAKKEEKQRRPKTL